MHKRIWIAGSVQAFLAVAIGAFGAHALKETIIPELLATYHTGTQYHMFHAVALLLTALAYPRGEENSMLIWAGRLFNLGIILFSGSLYALAVTGIRALGAITPLGGVAFLSGWVLLAIAQTRFVRK